MGGPADDHRVTPEQLRALAAEPLTSTIRIVAEARASHLWAGVYLGGGGDAAPQLVVSTVRERTPGSSDDTAVEWVVWWLGSQLAGGLLRRPD